MSKKKTNNNKVMTLGEYRQQNGYTQETTLGGYQERRRQELAEQQKREQELQRLQRQRMQQQQNWQNQQTAGIDDSYGKYKELMLQNAGSKQPAAGKNPFAFYGKGNIDLSRRPKVQNPDGSYSTVDSFSTMIDGKEVLLPTIVNGKRVSEDEAVQYFRNTGKNLGIFNTPDEATAYAQRLHDLQEKYYSGDEEHRHPFVNWAQNQLLKDPGYKTEKTLDKKTYDIYNARTLTRPFNEQSMLEQMADPNSRASQAYLDATKKRQAREAAAAAAPMQYDNQIYNKYFNQDNAPKEQNAATMEDARALAEYYWKTKNAGTQRTTNPLNMGEQQLQDYLTTAQQNYDNATAKEENFDKDAAHQDTLLKAEGQRLYHELNSRGLPLLENMNGDLYVPDVELWGQLDDTNFIRKRPDDGGDYVKKTENDALLYDAIYGNGAYEARWEEIYDIEDNAEADAEADKLDAEMDELWDRFENGNFQEEEQILTNEYHEGVRNERGLFGANLYGRQVELAQEEQARQARLAELTAAAPEGTGKYDESKVIWGLNQGAVDQVYYYANRELQGSDFSHYGNMRPATFMTDDQREVFNKYYLSGDKEGAKAFYDALEPYLKQIQTIYKSYLEDKMSRNGYAPIMIANRVLTQPMAGLTGTIGTGMALFGDKNAQDPNSDWYSMTRTNMNIQNARADVWGKQAAEWFGDDAEIWGQRLNGLAYSMADNLYAMALTGGAAGVNAEGWAGKTAESILQFIMSSEATATTMLERLDAGADPTEAALFSLGSGAIEWLTEKVSIEALLRPEVKELLGKPKELMKYLLKNATAEGSEEIASDVLGQTLDFVLSRMYGHESELEAQVSELKKNNPGMSDEEAWKQVFLNFGGELLVSGGMGALSGALMSGGRGVLTRFQVGSQNKAAGSNILNYGTDASMTADQTATKTEENLNGMIEAAGKFEPGTEVRDKADELLADMKKAKKPDPKKVGSLYRSLMEASSERTQGIINNIMGDVFADRMTELGETEENIPELKDALVNLVSGKESAADLKTIAKSESALKILSEYRMDDGAIGKAKTEVKAETEPFLSMQENMSAMATEPQTAEKAIRDTEEKMDGWKTADKASVLMAGGKSTESSVLYDGKTAEVTGITKNAENGSMQVTLADGSNVDLSEVKAVGEGLARTLQYLKNDQGRTVGSNLANALVQIGSRSKNSVKAVADAMSIMYSETLGMPAGKTSMRNKEAETVREAVRKDIDESEAKRTENGRKINPGQGKTTFKGVAYGSDAFRNALKGLDNSIRNEAMAIGSIAKSAGFDVELYYDKSDTSNQGSFSTGGGIRINLAGEFNTEGVRRSALATLSHEVTHWLEANSKDSYKALRSFVVSNLRKSGVNVQAELNNIIETYGAHGVDLDLAGAVAEMVAKGCEQVLTNENVVRQLKEQDPTLHGKIKEAVRKIVSRIRSAIADATNTSSRYAKQLMKYADQLSRIWLEAYNEALGANGKTETAEGKTEFAFRDEQKNVIEFNEETKIENRKAVAAMDPIITITQSDVDRFINAGDLIEEGGKYFEELGRYARNDVLGKVELANSGLRHFVGKGDATQIKAKTIPAIKAVIENGYVVNMDENHKGKKIDTAVVAGKVELPDGKYYVAVVVSQDNGGTRGQKNRYSFHNAIIIKEGTSEGSMAYTAENAAGSVTSGADSSIISILRDIENYNRQNKTRGQASIQEQDEQYADAVAREDWRTAEEMLLDKMQRTEGITGYNAPYFYTGEHQDIAKLIKSGNPEVIQAVVREMAPKVPENAVLIPMPPHEGKVLDSTDTMILARALSEATGRPVINALESDFHESRYKAKAAGKRNVNAKSMGFRQIAEIPEGTMPVFIDNMVGGGQTAIAAKNAIGRGITLAYAQSARSKSKGVKFTSVTYDNNGKLIPLSQRMDPNNPSWKYSMQEQDDQYMAAVESGDTDAAMKILVKEAKKNGYDTKHVAFHGSDDLGFTVFDMDLSQGQIFIAYNKELAGTYTNRPEIREIRSIDKNAKSYLHMTGEEIAKAYTESNMRGDARYISKEEISALIKEKEDNYLALFDKDSKEEVSFKGKTYKNAYELAKQLVEMGSDPKRAGDPVYQEYLQGVARKYGKKDPNENIFNSYNFEYKRTEIADEFFKVAGVNKNDTFKKGVISISFAPGRESYFPVSTVKKQMQNNYGENRGIYAFFTKPGKQLVVDANRSNWNSISWNAVRRAADNFDEEEFRKSDYRDKVTAKTREVAKWAKDHGYDSVRINNVYDNGGRGSGKGYGDIGIFFKESDVKSADPVTYDEAGEIILPSERYNDQNKDIRYSIQEQDEQYDEAVKAGDMETAQQIVDNVAKEKGFTEKVYHGTPTGGFTVFRDWSYFTKSKAYADRYRHTSASSSRAYSVEATQPQTYELYMNPGKVFDTRNPKAARIYNEARMEYGLGELSNTNSGLPDWTDGRDIIEFIEEKGLDYDTILLDEGGDPGENGPVSRGISYVTRNNRVKSAEAVTYDNKGKVISPSERFNIKENDIRFSMQEPVEVNRDGLIAVHNLGEDQLIKTLQLGGFAMPSIAVVKKGAGHNKYGDISVVFYPRTIDPKADRSNKVYGGDAWTPTYPTIEYKVNSKLLYKLVDKVEKLIPKNVLNGITMASIDETNTTNAINSARGDYVKALKNNLKLKLAYLADNGIEIKYPMREKQLSRRYSNEEIGQIVEALGEDTIREAYMNSSSYMDEHPEIAETMRKIKADSWDKEVKAKIGNKDTVLKMARMNPYTKENWGYSHSMDGLQGAWLYIQRGITQEVDERALKEVVDEKLDEKGYEEWLRKELNGIVEKQGIRNNKDYYTNSGNPRSWEQLHDEETLENVVRVMKAQEDKGSNSFFSQSEMLAVGTRDFKSLDDIRKHSGQLKHMEEEEYAAAKENIVNGFGQLMDELSDKNERNYLIARDRALEAMVDAVKKTRNPAAIERELRMWNGLNVRTGMGQRIADLMQEIADLPTEYFEAKPKRAVGLDEIAKVIVPETVGQELLDELDKRDIPYEMYDGTDEGHIQALNNQKDAQFSFMDETDVDARAWMETVQESSLQTEAEKSLLRNFKALRMRVSLKQEQERKYRGEIARLEAIPEGERTREQKSKLAGFKVRLENATKIKEQAQEELSRITSSSGYVSMMYRQQRVLNDFVYGRTQEEVRSAVERLERSAETIEKRIRANREAAEALEKSGIVDRFRKLLGTTTADQTAAELKKAYNSTWTKAQIRTYLDPIIAKMMAGENFEQDVEELAGILVNSDSTNNYEELSGLRGLTIRLGKGAMAELRAQNSSLKEVRARLAGTGIQVVQAKDIRDASGNVVDHERSTLEADIEDLRAEYPSIPDLGNEKDALGNFLDWIDGMKQASAANEFYEQRIAEAMAVITGKAAGAAKGIYMPNDSKAQKQVLAMMDFVKSLNAETAKAQKDLQDIADELEKMRKAGQQASGMANTMAHDANVAIDYFNRMARIAEDTAKQKTRKDLVEQLKSEHAKKIAKNNEEWRELIQRDREARKQLEKNRAYANRINTVLKRAYNRLKAPKGLQNVPEYMQGLVREVLGIFVDNDLAGGRRFTAMSRESLAETRRVLDEWIKESGEFNRDQLKDAEEAVEATLSMDLMIIRDGIAAINGDIRGKNKVEILERRGEILKEMQEAVSEIWSAVMAENTIQIRNRKIAVEDAAYKIATQMGNRRAKEWTGSAGGIMRTLHKAIISGNMTPEYFFRTLGNAGLNDLWEGYHEAENRNGLELAKAKARMEEIAKKYGYSTWDVNQKVTLDLSSGAQVQMTIGQLMSLYATWKRETALGPAVSEHLAGGGFYAEQDLRDGILGRTEVEKKAHRIKVERNEKGEIVASPDMMRVEGLLTDEQKQFVDEVVGFMSSDMSELGNEASMKAYGIKLYKEGYYFPFQMWDGVKSRKSSDAGSAAAAQDRAFHPSFSKSRMHGANNALIIGDFMKTVSDHVAGMINYATMGLANENLQKTLNFQLSEEDGAEEINKRNVWTMIEEAYGQEAAQYLRELQVQLNGGAVRTTKNIGDKLISLFRKNAVAGSMSVALQQPMSYIRAAMMINQKYLAAAMNPATWKGSYAEMMAHSGVAVIKDMGRFDMNFGQSAREYLMPEAKESTKAKVWNGIEEYSTILPELMDRMTWTRMWSACKAEMKAQHPEMDVKSDEFLDMVGERFNELMRRTQVYDSVLVKSANMRNDNYFIKSITSFMAEPTLTLNVLADAVRQAKSGEKGGKLALAKAGATFALSAVLQAAIKGLMGSGRTPDDKKTWEENFMNKFVYNFVNEIDPLQLVPGFSDLVTILKGGELKDDAFGTLSKLYKATVGTVDMLVGRKDLGYRNWEDGAAQIAQLFTGVPAKNIMRDMRAMWNWVIERPYADRETSGTVIRNQTMETIMNADNVLGIINQWLGDAGFKTDNSTYYKRIYEAKKAGNEKEAEDLIDYLLTGGKVKKRETIDSKVAAMAKDDAEMSAEDTAEFLIGEGANAETYIKDQLKQGKMSAEDARKMLKKADPTKTDDDVWWVVDRIEYQLETGAEKALSGNTYYYRLTDAVNNNSANEIQTAVKSLLAHGIKKERIKDKLSDWRSEYLAADSNGKRKIRDAMQKAYKAIGLTAAEADKTIEKWEKDAKKKKN